MAVPKGYVKIEPNTLYENVEYYIDTSVKPTSIKNINNITPSFDTAPCFSYGTIVNYPSVPIIFFCRPIGGVTYSNETLVTHTSNTDYDWDTEVIVDGKYVKGSTVYNTVNINFSQSPDWLYVKVPKGLVPLYDDDELQSEKSLSTITTNQTLEVVADGDFVAMKKVKLTVNVPQLDTSDATATSSDMLSGKTAYVGGVKVTGNIQTYTPSQEVVENGTLAVKGKYISNDIVVNVQPTLKENYEFVANGEYPVPEGFDGYGTVKVTVPNVNPYTASSESEFNTYLAEENVGNIVKYTGETTETLKKGRLYIVKSTKNEISFTINGTSYTADEGMTWGEWLDSEYNTGGFIAGYGDYYVTDTNDSYVVYYDSTPQDIYDTIISYAYITKYYIGGGGSND